MVVKGSPNPEVKWFSNNQPIVENERMQTKVRDDIYTLIIDGVELYDENVYKCTASNDYGLIECSCNLLVNETPQKPEFLKELKNIVVEEGSDATFDVEVSGQPEPEVLWFRDDVLQRPDDRIETLKEGNIHTFG